jgi:hypothetical protein
MAKEEIEFVDGLIVKAPSPKAPDFVKASISIKVEDLGKWLRAKYKGSLENDGWINIDVKEAKSGKWYAAVSTFKPKAKEEAPTRQVQQPPNGGKFDDMADDIPF